MTYPTQPKTLFSPEKKYKIRFKLSEKNPFLTYRNAKVIDESENFVLILDAVSGKKLGYSKHTIVQYEEEQ
jgi:hypothetical protein